MDIRIGIESRTGIRIIVNIASSVDIEGPTHRPRGVRSQSGLTPGPGVNARAAAVSSTPSDNYCRSYPTTAAAACDAL
ncbi:hypothetical protein EVAR_68211_1 [Eumeta japonica]|uniref:Uncharacterized protein n=1 Tax=Eumeta variegata TaxID=151549 RepID=A0A4C1SVA3_EUMVA|nr:hypothetical protein EVAR_68211_1 [Eumeta japonica]